KICVFYSRGPHFLRALATMRQTYPEARLEGWVPKGFTAPEQTKDFADAIVVTDRASYGVRDLGAMGALIAQMRDGEYDCLGVMFPSVKLKILASLTGKAGVWCTPDGRLVPLSASVAGAIASEVFYGLVGRMTYWSIWVYVLT